MRPSGSATRLRKRDSCHTAILSTSIGCRLSMPQLRKGGNWPRSEPAASCSPQCFRPPTLLPFHSSLVVPCPPLLPLSCHVWLRPAGPTPAPCTRRRRRRQPPSQRRRRRSPPQQGRSIRPGWSERLDLRQVSTNTHTWRPGWMSLRVDSDARRCRASAHLTAPLLGGCV